MLPRYMNSAVITGRAVGHLRCQTPTGGIVSKHEAQGFRFTSCRFIFWIFGSTARAANLDTDAEALAIFRRGRRSRCMVSMRCAVVLWSPRDWQQTR